jgi:hypothetical protein
MVKLFILLFYLFGLQSEEDCIFKIDWLQLAYFKGCNVFYVGWVKRISIVPLFAALFQKVFGLIFGIDVIFIGLVGTGMILFGGWPLNLGANIFSPLL